MVMPGMSRFLIGPCLSVTFFASLSSLRTSASSQISGRCHLGQGEGGGQGHQRMSGDEFFHGGAPSGFQRDSAGEKRGCCRQGCHQQHVVGGHCGCRIAGRPCQVSRWACPAPSGPWLWALSRSRRWTSPPAHGLPAHSPQFGRCGRSPACLGMAQRLRAAVLPRRGPSPQSRWPRRCLIQSLQQPQPGSFQTSTSGRLWPAGAGGGGDAGTGQGSERVRRFMCSPWVSAGRSR
jgi:hypothetical protein